MLSGHPKVTPHGDGVSFGGIYFLLYDCLFFFINFFTINDTKCIVILVLGGDLADS